MNINVWSLEKGNLMKTFTKHREFVYDIDLSLF